MELKVENIGEVTVARIEGNLDTQTSTEAQEKLSSLIDDGATKVLIDFEGLAYISSAGLRVLLATAKQLKGAGGDLRISSLNDVAKEVFEISGFIDILKVFDDRAAAIQDF
jgi:anti-anti-sigma factor